LTLYAKQRGALRVVASNVYPPGTPLAEVVTGCTEPHDPAADQKALLKLAAWCERFSPCVGVEPPDNLCFDVTGLDALFGNEKNLFRLVARSFQQLGIAARVAIADTLGAAWAMAHFSQGEHALADLPVAALRLGDEIELLVELGIKRIGQLLEIPRDALASRFGPQLLLRLAQLTGDVAEPIVSHRPPPEIVVEIQLEYAAENRQEVEQLLAELIERAALELQKRQQGAIRVGCEFDCECRSVQFVVGLYRASAKRSHLFELAKMKLDRVSFPGPVVGVKLSVLLSAPLSTWQQELFESSRREDRRQVGLLVDRLSNRLGREAVVRALPMADAQPELAVWYEPLTGAPSRRTKQRWKPLPRPLCLEQEPQPLEVLSIAPHGPPIRFQWRGLHTVAKQWGPERIQTGWWRGRYIQRDYYRVETETGQRFWLFRNLPDDQWFLHGVFD
jgi:protein ImuB